MAYVITEVRPAGDANASWSDAKSDADGSNLIACVWGGRLYTSADGGTTWTERRPAGDVNCSWAKVASDADGSNLIAVANGGRVWTSANSGATWTERRPKGDVNSTWRGCASDADGSVLMVGEYPGYFWFSLDSGATWTKVDLWGASGWWVAIDCSDDGSVMYAAASNSNLFVSTDHWATWTEHTESEAWYIDILACNNDGSHILTAPGIGDSGLEISTDNCLTWNACQPVLGYWYAVDMDSSGSFLFIGDYGGRLYTSIDDGANWSEQRPAGDANASWQAIGTDSTGSNLIAGVDGGRLYTLRTPPVTILHSFPWVGKFQLCHVT